MDADLHARFQNLKQRLDHLSRDFEALEELLKIDVPSSLNKIRFITEKVLNGLCQRHRVSWGKGEPTLERIIGPPVSGGHVPKDVSIYVRTIQTNTSPGSHHQETLLSASHVGIAQKALVEFLEWYYSEHGDGSDAKQTQPERARRRPSGLSVSCSVQLAAMLLLVGLVGYYALIRGPDQLGPVEVLRLADTKRIQDLRSQADSLTARTLRVSDAQVIDSWFTAAEELITRVDSHKERLTELRQRAVMSQPPWWFENEEDQWQYDVLAELVYDLESLSGSKHGPMTDVRRKMERARELVRRTLEEDKESWEQALHSIADPMECPTYNRLKIAPQVGLVPLGKDAEFGLWEFGDLGLGR